MSICAKDVVAKQGKLQGLFNDIIVSNYRNWVESDVKADNKKEPN